MLKKSAKHEGETKKFESQSDCGRDISRCHRGSSAKPGPAPIRRFLPGLLARFLGFYCTISLHENNSFSADNLLAPCEKIKKTKSSNLCYEFHHRIYLPSAYSTRAEDLVALCLSSENTESCLSGLAGAYTAAAGNIIVSDMLPEESLHRIERAGIHCGAFPDKYRPLCYRFVYTRFLHNEILPAKTLVQKICSGTGNLKNTCLSILEEEFAPTHRQN